MAYLILEDGTIFEGQIFGSKMPSVGEVVFNTGMTGYEGVLTDPTYYGQIVVMTYPLIGNYGMNSGDTDSVRPYVKGIVVRELCESPSNWASEGTLGAYLEKHGICGIEGVDTRALTRKIRESGTLRGMIKEDAPTDADFARMKEYKIDNPVKEVSAKESYIPHAEKGNENSADFGLNKGARVAVLDYGLKVNLLNKLVKRGYDIKVFPSLTSAEEIKRFNPDGIILSSGPGDPNDNAAGVEVIKQLLGFKPIFGISLGHQLLALACGASTARLRYGHRGSNHPVKDTDSGRVYITSQNHGYTVEADSLTRAVVTHINWNDMTCEGLRHLDYPAFGVQFCPDTGSGPMDTGYLFDTFDKMMSEHKGKQN